MLSNIFRLIVSFLFSRHGVLAFSVVSLVRAVFYLYEGCFISAGVTMYVGITLIVLLLNHCISTLNREYEAYEQKHLGQ